MAGIVDKLQKVSRRVTLNNKKTYRGISSESIKQVSEESRIPVIVYGHAGDGNVHLHPICLNMDGDEWRRRLPDLMREVYKTGVSFGGAISGEHGIGVNKKAYLHIGVTKRG